MIAPYSQRSMNMVTFRWVPWCLQYTMATGVYGWLELPAGLCLRLGLAADYDEVEIWRLGPLYITRAMTMAEVEAMEEAQAEERFLAYESHRYTEWSY